MEVGDVVYVELFNNPDGKPKGSGVIEFKDIATAKQAIEKMHRYEIKDRKLVVREERERDRRQNDMAPRGGAQGMMGPGPNMGMGMGGRGGGGMGSGASSGMGSQVSPQILQQLGIEGPLSNSVFVSNLDYKVNWKKLKDVFRLAGNVLRAEIKEDKDGKSRGMGTVTFETPMEAVQAISMFNSQSLYDRTMRVRMDGQGAPGSRPEAPPLPSGLKSVGPALSSLSQMNTMDMNMGGSGMGMSGMGMDSMRGGMGNMDSGMNRMGSSMSSMGGMGNMSGMGGMSGMSSMSSGMGSGMSGMGGMGSGMGMGMGDSFSGGMSGMSGMGSNNMGSSSMGVSGLNDGFGMSSMSGGMGGGSSYGSLMDSSRGSGMGSFGSSGGSSRMDYGRDRGSRSDRVGSSSLETGDMKTRADRSTVIVKNLPYSIDWQTLKARFQSIGDIRFAEISKNDKGKSNGWGLVSFRREDDAQLAVQKMNRSNLEGRDIVVKLLN